MSAPILSDRCCTSGYVCKPLVLGKEDSFGVPGDGGRKLNILGNAMRPSRQMCNCNPELSKPELIEEYSGEWGGLLLPA